MGEELEIVEDDRRGKRGRVGGRGTGAGRRSKKELFTITQSPPLCYLNIKDIFHVNPRVQRHEY
jgi:hypothetical protein